MAADDRGATLPAVGFAAGTVLGTFLDADFACAFVAVLPDASAAGLRVEADLLGRVVVAAELRRCLGLTVSAFVRAGADAIVLARALPSRAFPPALVGLVAFADFAAPTVSARLRVAWDVAPLAIALPVTAPVERVRLAALPARADFGGAVGVALRAARAAPDLAAGFEADWPVDLLVALVEDLTGFFKAVLWDAFGVDLGRDGTTCLDLALAMDWILLQDVGRVALLAPAWTLHHEKLLAKFPVVTRSTACRTRQALWFLAAISADSSPAKSGR